MTGGVRSLGWESPGFGLAFLAFFVLAEVGWVGVRDCWREEGFGGWDVPSDGTASVAGGLVVIMRKRQFPVYKPIDGGPVESAEIRG